MPTNNSMKTYEDWLEYMHNNERRLSLYDCPHCGFETQALRPDEDADRPFSSLTVCPKCEQIYMKWVHADGLVNIRSIEGGSVTSFQTTDD